MVPNAWLTRKWCFFGHLNFIITFSVHKLKVCPSHSSLWDVVEVLAIRMAIPWIIGLNQAHAFTKRFIKSSWNMEVTVLQNWGKRWIESVATYPSAGGRRVTRGMRVPRKEYARSRHQRLFEENVGKTGKDAIYELLSERFGSCIYARGRY